MAQAQHDPVPVLLDAHAALGRSIPPNVELSWSLKGKGYEHSVEAKPTSMIRTTFFFLTLAVVLMMMHSLSTSVDCPPPRRRRAYLCLILLALLIGYLEK